MSLITAQHITFYHGADCILKDVSFSLHPGGKVGLVGANGSGKTTLLNIIAGLEPHGGGQITKIPGLTLGYLRQFLPEGVRARSVHEFLRSAFGHLIQLEARLESLETRMADAEAGNGNGELDDYGTLLVEFEAGGGYDYPRKIEQIIDGLSLLPLLDRPLASLSGGEKNIVSLARMLLVDPDLLLLDEPGNHLDFKGLTWLEQYLRDSEKSVLIVSHDRYLLDRVVDRIFELENCQLKEYAGNYSACRAEKTRQLLIQKQAYDDQQKEIHRLQDMIKRFEHWASIVVNKRHIVQARNKQKMLDRMEKIDRPQMQQKVMKTNFQQASRSGHIALELKDYKLHTEDGSRVLHESLNTLLESGSRMGLLGANGCGKSTLIKAVYHTASWENPNMRIGPKVIAGYYSQEHETLNQERTLCEEVCHRMECKRDVAFRLLNKYLFGWHDIDKKIATLSGGEKSRLQLALLTASPSNFLLLDEPTNHLDIPSRERLEEALEDFSGTLLVISHDRCFLDRIAGGILLMEKGRGIRRFDGQFSDYWREQQMPHQVKGKAGTVNAGSSKPSGRGGKSSRDNKSRAVEELENRIESLETEKLNLESKAVSAFNNRDFKQGETLSRKLRILEKEIEKAYDLL